ncbi:MAG: histidine kinase [Bacteroidales bacterium]|nr:histidine kinase [Bacteroidales bacterium]
MSFVKDLIKPFSIIQYLLVNLGFSLLILMFFTSGPITGTWNYLFYGLWSFLVVFTQWTGAVLINHLLDRKIKWIDKPVLRSILGIAILIFYSVIAFMLVKYMMYFIKYRSMPEDAWAFAATSSLFTVLISFNMSLIFTAIGFFKAWKRAVVNAEKLKTEMMAYKYESLRNQINPHFLFNSFNVLSDLVYADQAMAVKFINQLSDLFRYVLDSRDKELVPLSDELAFMQSYIYLLKTRFEDKLDLKIELKAESDELIVPMTLQLLVENAVKHNEVSEAFPLQIRILRNDTFIEVENSLRIKRVGDDSKNTGLKNIIQQFGYFTDRQIDVINANGSFLVRVPILKASEK